MFFQFTVILVAIGAAVGDLSECRARLRNDCMENKDLPSEIPSTPEGLRRDCENMQKMLRCAKNVFESCPEVEEEAHLAERYLNKLKETCDENSDTYEVLSRHISCAGPMLNNIEDVCDLTTINEDGEKFFRPVSVTDKKRAHLLNCGHKVRTIMCSSIAVSKRCGAAELKDILDDLMRNFSRWYAEECTPDVLNQLQPDIQDYENALLQRDF